MVDTPIEGLQIHSLRVHEDNRGWFKENWAGQALVPAQQNVSFNARRGAPRGGRRGPGQNPSLDSCLGSRCHSLATLTWRSR